MDWPCRGTSHRIEAFPQDSCPSLWPMPCTIDLNIPDHICLCVVLGTHWAGAEITSHFYRTCYNWHPGERQQLTDQLTMICQYHPQYMNTSVCLLRTYGPWSLYLPPLQAYLCPITCRPTCALSPADPHLSSLPRS